MSRFTKKRVTNVVFCEYEGWVRDKTTKFAEEGDVEINLIIGSGTGFRGGGIKFLPHQVMALAELIRGGKSIDKEVLEFSDNYEQIGRDWADEEGVEYKNSQLAPKAKKEIVPVSVTKPIAWYLACDFGGELALCGPFPSEKFAVAWRDGNKVAGDVVHSDTLLAGDIASALSPKVAKELLDTMP